jgi:hypothetical protein
VLVLPFKTLVFGDIERRQVMNDTVDPEKIEAKKVLLDLFEGVKGYRPKTDQELNEWLASPEGKAATVFEVTSLSRWGETGRT